MTIKAGGNFEGMPGGYYWLFRDIHQEPRRTDACWTTGALNSFSLVPTQTLVRILRGCFPVPSMSRALISEAGKFVLMHLLKGSGLLAAGSRLILLRAETDQAYGFTNSCCLRSIWTWYASDGGAGLCTMYTF